MAVVGGNRFKALHGEHRVEHLRAALQAIADAEPARPADELREQAADALRADDREAWSTASSPDSSSRRAP